MSCVLLFFFQAEDGIRDKLVTGVQTCALPILRAILRQVTSGLTHEPHRGEGRRPSARGEQQRRGGRGRSIAGAPAGINSRRGVFYPPLGPLIREKTFLPNLQNPRGSRLFSQPRAPPPPPPRGVRPG